MHGVDLNPYAVAIARFRLLLAAMRECRIDKPHGRPELRFNLVCGDSLLHGSTPGQQGFMGSTNSPTPTRARTCPSLARILSPGFYHAVVANPPYITVKDQPSIRPTAIATPKSAT